MSKPWGPAKNYIHDDLISLLQLFIVIWIRIGLRQFLCCADSPWLETSRESLNLGHENTSDSSYSKGKERTEAQDRLCCILCKGLSDLLYINSVVMFYGVCHTSLFRKVIITMIVLKVYYLFHRNHVNSQKWLFCKVTITWLFWKSTKGSLDSPVKCCQIWDKTFTLPPFYFMWHCGL